jgi:uncharacterized membrane protein
MGPMIATAWYMVIFRLIHILVGVAWVGSVFLLVTQIQPTAAAIAPAGAPFMFELLGKRRLVERIIGMGVVTVVAGLFLYWRDWHACPSFGDWIGSNFGATLTVGAIAAIAALSIGIAVTRPKVDQMLALMRQIGGSGGAPVPELVAQLGAIQARLRVAARASLVLLVIAVIAMSSARYL